MERWIICSAIGDGKAVVNAVADPARLFARRRGSGVPAVPLAACWADPETIARMLGVARLPMQVPLADAARLFGRLPMPAEVLPAVLREFRCALDVGGVLLAEWQRAVDAVKEVAAV